MFTPQDRRALQTLWNSLEILSSFNLSCAVIWILEITLGSLILKLFMFQNQRITNCMSLKNKIKSESKEPHEHRVKNAGRPWVFFIERTSSSKEWPKDLWAVIWSFQNFKNGGLHIGNGLVIYLEPWLWTWGLFQFLINHPTLVSTETPLGSLPSEGQLLLFPQVLSFSDQKKSGKFLIS